MKIIVTLTLCFLAINSVTKAQNCSTFFSTDKFTKERKTDFYFDGYAPIQTFVRLTFKFTKEEIETKNSFTVECTAGTGKKINNGFFEVRDYESLTKNYLTTPKNYISITFLFDDETTITIHSQPNCMYCNTAYFDSKETPSLIEKFKNHKLTDIRFGFNALNGDFSIPVSNSENPYSTQTFGQTMISCLGW